MGHKDAKTWRDCAENLLRGGRGIGVSYTEVEVAANVLSLFQTIQSRGQESTCLQPTGL